MLYICFICALYDHYFSQSQVLSHCELISDSGFRLASRTDPGEMPKVSKRSLAERIDVGLVYDCCVVSMWSKFGVWNWSHLTLTHLDPFLQSRLPIQYSLILGFSYHSLTLGFFGKVWRPHRKKSWRMNQRFCRQKPREMPPEPGCLMAVGITGMNIDQDSEAEADRSRNDDNRWVTVQQLQLTT